MPIGAIVCPKGFREEKGKDVKQRKGNATPEGALLRLVLDYLAARHIFSLRMQTGVLRNPAGRPVTFGLPGQADILAFPRASKVKNGFANEHVIPYWIELKAPKGKQSELQKSFQAKVESEGMRYLLIRSLDELEAQL